MEKDNKDPGETATEGVEGVEFSYELKVPKDVDLDSISTVNGDVEISGVSGLVKAETVNGSLTASGLVGDVNLETVNGSVEAKFDQLGDGQRVTADAVNAASLASLSPPKMDRCRSRVTGHMG